MAISRTFTYLGKLHDGGMGMEVSPAGVVGTPAVDAGVGPPKHVWIGRYDIEHDDTYSRTTKITFTFNGLSRITDVLGLYSTCVANVANVLQLVSVTNAIGAAPILLAAPLEGAGVGDPFDEKPEEAYGETMSFFAVVAGV